MDDMAAQQAAKHYVPVVQQHDSMVSPEWLKKISPEAAVHTGIYQIFESLRDGDQCLAQVMKSITGKCIQSATMILLPASKQPLSPA